MAVIILEFFGVWEMCIEVKVVPGLGIEPRTRGFSIPSKKTKCSISTNSFLLVCLEKMFKFAAI